jgi:ElaB/YqjD/DUF883 family membrane-anchored ribosome-binding protein
MPADARGSFMPNVGNADGNPPGQSGSRSHVGRSASLGNAAGEKIQEILDSSHETLETLKKKSFEDLYQEARTFVRENPGKTLLGALAAGFLLGSILRRR